MRLTGLIGGMSWESTAEYYRLFNESIRTRLGGTHSARLLLYSFDFHEIEALQHEEAWERLAELMIEAGRALVRSGAEQLLLCTNTMHSVYDELAASLEAPVLHIADAAARAVHADGARTVGLLGTKFTMESAFYRERIEATGIRVLVPGEAGRELVHRVIYDELCCGVVSDSSRDAFLRIIDDLSERGCEGVILGCTEIPLLIRSGDASVPVYDTTRLHVEAAVEEALK